MAAASSSRDSTGDETTDRTKITTLGLFATTEMSSRPNNASANLYSPLLVPARAPTVHSRLPDPPTKDSSTTTTDDVSKTSTALMKQISKPTLDLRAQNSRGQQRSSVRPFFCCGSELSLVSLVDGMDIKDNCSKGKNLDVSCNSISAEDECASYSSQSGKDSASSAAHSSNESRHALVRRKLKDKHGAKKKSWSSHFRRRWNPTWRVSETQHSSSHRYDRSNHITSGTYHRSGSPGLNQMPSRPRSLSSSSQFVDLAQLQDFDRLYPVNDVDTVRIKERVEEMRAGIEMDSLSFTRSYRPLQQASNSVFDMLQPRSSLGSFSSDSALPSPETPTHDFSGLINSVLLQWQGSRTSSSSNVGLSGSPRIHTQVDFIHCLVPDLVRILNCPFYWGVMDRYEAERLLDSKPEGTFLLRDSAQEDFLFSVSFRRYNRSLHARVEQWNHRFSFDAHDNTVFSAPTVCELMEHYKDPCCCMFFEPMLTRPLPRNFPFSLQHMCRAVICDHVIYDQIRYLPLPNSLKQFLQIYHYKQKVRVRRFDGPDVNFATSDVAS